MKKIWINGYPCLVSFHTATDYPPFKYGCPVRTNEARIAIEAHGHNEPHDTEDFVVEYIIQTPDGEVWEVAS